MQKQFIIILMAIAAILGFFIYRSQQKGQPTENVLINSQQKDQQTEKVSVNSQAGPHELTPEEKKVITGVGPNVSMAEQEAHRALAERLAVTSATLDITSCVPNPAVLRMRYKDKIKVINNDNTERQIFVDSSHMYMIPAKSSADIVFEFEIGVGGLHGYGCDTGPGPAGLFLVVN